MSKKLLALALAAALVFSLGTTAFAATESDGSLTGSSTLDVPTIQVTVPAAPKLTLKPLAESLTVSGGAAFASSTFVFANKTADYDVAVSVGIYAAVASDVALEDEPDDDTILADGTTTKNAYLLAKINNNADAIQVGTATVAPDFTYTDFDLGTDDADGTKGTIALNDAASTDLAFLLNKPNAASPDTLKGSISGFKLEGAIEPGAAWTANDIKLNIIYNAKIVSPTVFSSLKGTSNSNKYADNFDDAFAYTTADSIAQPLISTLDVGATGPVIVETDYASVELAKTRVVTKSAVTNAKAAVAGKLIGFTVTTDISIVTTGDASAGNNLAANQAASGTKLTTGAVTRLYVYDYTTSGAADNSTAGSATLVGSFYVYVR